MKQFLLIFPSMQGLIPEAITINWLIIIFSMTCASIFHSAAALFAKQSAVLITITSVSVRLSHAGIVPRRIKNGSCGLHCEVAKTL